MAVTVTVEVVDDARVCDAKPDFGHHAPLQLRLDVHLSARCVLV